MALIMNDHAEFVDTFDPYKPMRLRHVGPDAMRWAPPPPDASTCKGCGQPFYKTRSTQEYCCQECAKREQRRRAAKKKAASRAKPKKVAKCLTCGKEFEQHRSTHVYCCKKCAGVGLHRGNRVYGSGDAR